MTKDYLVKVTGLIAPQVFQASIVGCEPPEGFRGVITLSSVSGRMSGSGFEKTLKSTGLGGYLIAYQMNELGECCYISRLKNAADAKRVFFAPALNVCLYHSTKSGAGRKTVIETPWELYNASRSYEQKLTILATVAKTDALVLNNMDSVVSEMKALFQSLQSPSYTPKLILIDSGNDRSFEVFGTRGATGSLDWSATEKYIHNDERLLSALSNGPITATKAVVIRLSDMSSRSMVDRLMQSAGPGRTNHIVERFFNTTRCDGYPLYSTGVVVTGIGNGYEYGEKAESLGDGRKIGDILNATKS